MWNSTATKLILVGVLCLFYSSCEKSTTPAITDPSSLILGVWIANHQGSGQFLYRTEFNFTDSGRIVGTTYSHDTVSGEERVIEAGTLVYILDDTLPIIVMDSSIGDSLLIIEMDSSHYFYHLTEDSLILYLITPSDEDPQLTRMGSPTDGLIGRWNAGSFCRLNACDTVFYEFTQDSLIVSRAVTGPMTKTAYEIVSECRYNTLLGDSILKKYVYALRNDRAYIYECGHDTLSFVRPH